MLCVELWSEKNENRNFHHYFFFNIDFSLDIANTALKFGAGNPFNVREGSVSQILYLDDTLYFM